MFDRRNMVAFTTLMQELSVTKAADKLNISQPAMSATLRKLRATLGDPLFVKVGRSLCPTDRAIEIQKIVKEISGLLDGIDRDRVSFDPRADPLSLRLQASDHTHSLILSNVMAALLVEAPQADLTIRPLAYEYLERDLEKDVLDFAILPDFLAPPNMQMRKIFEESFVCIMRKDHPAASANLTVEALSKCQHIRVAPVLVQGQNRLDQSFKKANLVRDVKLTVANYGAVPDVVASTDLLSFFPSSLARFLDARFTIKSSPVHLAPHTMSLVWHPRKQTSASHKWARNFLIRAASRFIANEKQGV